MSVCLEENDVQIPFHPYQWPIAPDRRKHHSRSMPGHVEHTCHQCRAGKWQCDLRPHFASVHGDGIDDR